MKISNPSKIVKNCENSHSVPIQAVINVFPTTAIPTPAVPPKIAVTKNTAYTFEWTLETAVAGDIVIEVVNNSPSKNTGNKDRVAIWNFTVTGVVA